MLFNIHLRQLHGLLLLFFDNPIHLGRRGIQKGLRLSLAIQDTGHGLSEGRRQLTGLRVGIVVGCGRAGQCVLDGLVVRPRLRVFRFMFTVQIGRVPWV